ncbi:MAG: hypothetical protein WAM39_16410 [Bryobacteraceae bacterium]
MEKHLGLSAGVLALLALAVHVSYPPAQDGTPSSGIKAARTARPVAKPGESGKASPQEARTDLTDEHLEGPWLASREFLYAEDPPALPDPDGSQLDPFQVSKVSACAKGATCRQNLKAFFGLNQGEHSFEFVIATIADPLRTRLGLATDSTINAIEEGAANSSWDFAGQWLPWNDTPNPSEADPDTRRDERKSIREQELQPGLLIFRHQPKEGHRDGRVLFVFLVGETPTGGINGLQFKMARAYVEAFQDSGLVRILGPSFSGSFYSLTELIRNDQSRYIKAKEDYVIRSGTATSVPGANMLRDVASNFNSANESVADQQLHFCETLESLHVAPQDAAFLIEGESGYGNAFTMADSKRHLACQGVRLFRFPREISHLRNAYRDVVAQTKDQNAPVPDINFSLKDANTGEDSVPVFSETQTPLSQNAVMQEIANQIRRSHIRMVEAGATNVLDLLFVARVIREQCPDTRLVVIFPDLLFVQALQTEPLNGILALSTYPLFFERTRWINDPRTGVTFTDMNAEGVYNATAMLLSAPLSNHMSDVQKTSFEDYGWTGSSHPPTWLMVLNRSGFSPVRVFTSTRNPGWFEDGAKIDTKFQLPLASRAWVLAVVTISACSLTLCCLIGYLAKHPASRFLDLFAPDKGWMADLGRQFFLFLLLLALAFLQLVLYIPWLFREHQYPAIALQALLISGIGASVSTAAWIAIARLWRSKRSGGRWSVLLSALVFLGAVSIWAYCCHSDNDRSFFISFRGIEMQFGSSPILPIAAAGVALLVFAVVHLRRFHLVASQRPRLFTSTFDTALEGTLKKSRREMNRVLMAPLGMCWKEYRIWTILLVVGFALVCFLIRVPVNLASIDGRAYDALCIPLQLLLATALVLTCWQIRSAWGWFHSFLASLNALPVARAFTQVTEVGHRAPIWARRLNLLSLDIPIQSARTLHDMELVIRSAPDVAGKIEAADVALWHTPYREALKKLLSFEGTDQGISRREVRTQFRRLKHIGGLISDQISKQVLSPYWRATCLTVSNAGDAPARSDGTRSGASDREKFHDLAQSFVAYHLSAFALYGVRQIQNLLWFLSLGFVILTFSLSCYDFQAPRLIGRFLILLFASLAYVVWRCMAGMERDVILSRLSGTEEGELNKGFYLKLIGYGALPVLSVLASQFPTISKFLFSWVQPALEALQ